MRYSPDSLAAGSIGRWTARRDRWGCRRGRSPMTTGPARNRCCSRPSSSRIAAAPRRRIRTPEGCRSRPWWRTAPPSSPTARRTPPAPQSCPGTGTQTAGPTFWIRIAALPDSGWALNSLIENSGI